MDMTTIFGLLAGLAALIGGFLLEGGQFGGLLKLTAALIVFGGTFAAVIISFPLSRLRTIPQALKFAFTKPEYHQNELMDELTEFASITRRHGLLAIEKRVSAHPNEFLREGLLMTIDGTDPQLIRQILELEMDVAEQKHENHAKMFESAGGYAPTMGIIGTVMGLIHVLGNLTDPSTLGASIAIAFTATLYGVVSANLIYLPIASKIQTRSQDELQHMEFIMQGILAIQAGEHPHVVRRKLNSMLLVEDPSITLLQLKKKAIEHETQE
ncbi:motility protein A [Paenibacillus selenitireducens]|uniref:Motility protein A n=1 Tax=Paenibacillus selenitireducens TaxID=1324314 RepID=A0A1T2X876_9BACL|nr:flagellar motor protein [Paenibacillus selenitireducens]OPA76099.1 motility protein A [Paenibacillus selenitireducens]